MKNHELWQQYDKYTKDLSDNARKLAFAAAALAWFFKNADNSFPPSVLISLRLIIIFFIADFLQYFLGALFIRFWTRHHEKIKYSESKSIEGEYNKPPWLDYPSFCMWWLKICVLLGAYVFLGKHVFT